MDHDDIGRKRATGGGNFGHPTERELPSIDRLLDLDLISPPATKSLRQGKFVERLINGAPILVSPPFPEPPAGALITARYDNGYWVKTPQGSRNVSPGSFRQPWAVCGR